MSEIAVLFHCFINVSVKTQLIGNLINNIKLFSNVKCDFINVRVCVCVYVCIYIYIYIYIYMYIYESSEKYRYACMCVSNYLF